MKTNHSKRSKTKQMVDVQILPIISVVMVGVSTVVFLTTVLFAVFAVTWVENPWIGKSPIYSSNTNESHQKISATVSLPAVPESVDLEELSNQYQASIQEIYASVRQVVFSDILSEDLSDKIMEINSLATAAAKNTLDLSVPSEEKQNHLQLTILFNQIAQKAGTIKAETDLSALNKILAEIQQLMSARESEQPGLLR